MFTWNHNAAATCAAAAEKSKGLASMGQRLGTLLLMLASLCSYVSDVY